MHTHKHTRTHIQIHTLTKFPYKETWHVYVATWFRNNNHIE